MNLLPTLQLAKFTIFLLMINEMKINNLKDMYFHF